MVILWACAKIASLGQNRKHFVKQYWKEIFLLLVIKAILLAGIWYVCFRTPLILDDKTAGEHILG